MLLKLEVIGYLAKDAIKREVNGKTVINFSIPYNDKYVSNGKTVEKTTWVECSWWPNSYGLLPYMVKGALFYVEGQPSARSYVDKNGQTINQLALTVRNIRIIKSVDGPVKEERQQPKESSRYDDDLNKDNSDLPF